MDEQVHVYSDDGLQPNSVPIMNEGIPGTPSDDTANRDFALCFHGRGVKRPRSTAAQLS